MTNQLTQAELINLAFKSGLTIAGDDYGNEYLWVDKATSVETALEKFAQLIQQRQVARIADRWSIEDSGWWNSDRSVYTCPIRVGSWGARIECRGETPESARELAEKVMGFPTASQLVAQALEKAAQYVDGMVSDEDGRVILTKSTISVGIRALIDQPVDHSEESLDMVETQKNS